MFEAPGLLSVTRNRSRIESLLLTAIDLDPDFALAYNSLARLYASLGEEALTLEYARKALELDPELGSAYAAMASMYRTTGRFDEALEVSEQGVLRSPSDPVVLGGYAASLVAAGRGEESLRVLDRVIELDPAGAVNFFSVSFSRWLAGDRDGGLVAMRRSVELRSARYPRMILGMMEFTLGNRAEGVTQVQLALPLTSDDLLLLPVHAYSYRVVGLPDDAVRIARTWVASDEEFRPEDQFLIQSLYYHLVLDEEEQALDALVRLIENPGVIAPPTRLAMTNMFDDPTLEKPEFAALLAELRAKVGWN